MISINEVFPTVQGEGPLAGSPCILLRLHGCPVGCAWCDVPFTWDGSEQGERMTIGEAVKRVRRASRNLVRHVVVSGGEPVIQSGLGDLLHQLQRLVGWSGWVEVETSGVHRPPKLHGVAWATRWNVSPKMPSACAKIAPDLDVLRHWMERLGGKSILKLVVADEVDLDAAIELVDKLAWPSGRVWLMPEGTTRERVADRLAWLLETVVGRGLHYRVSGRMHVTAFGNRRTV